MRSLADLWSAAWQHFINLRLVLSICSLSPQHDGLTHIQLCCTKMSSLAHFSRLSQFPSLNRSKPTPPRPSTHKDCSKPGAKSWLCSAWAVLTTLCPQHRNSSFMVGTSAQEPVPAPSSAPLKPYLISTTRSFWSRAVLHGRIWQQILFSHPAWAGQFPQSANLLLYGGVSDMKPGCC